MILEVSGLTQKYVRDEKEFLALDQVDFYSEGGQLISIIGESGSGKSTFFHLITGMQKPTKGSIRIDGTEVMGDSRTFAQLRRKKVSYLLQGQNLLNNFSVLDNICMPLYLSKDKRDVTAKAEELLHRVGLSHVRSSFPDQLSGGEAKRVAVIRALINDPAIIVADEPTGNLDSDNSRRIMELFREISNSGVTVLVSTHDHRFLEYSDHVYRMEKGKLLQLRL